MLKFTKKDDNKQFISITVKRGSTTRKVYDYIKNLYPEIEKGLYAVDEQEIILTLGEVDYTFSLNKLREDVAKIADADISFFCVDVNNSVNQRTGGARTTAKDARKPKIIPSSKVCLQPSGDVQSRGDWADSILQNAFSIGNKTIAYVPVALLNIQPYQRDKQKHITKIAENWDDDKCTILLVSYDENRKWFNVMDGQHRAVAAKMRGITYLVCEIFTGLTLSTEALKFVDSNINSKKLNAYDVFNANQYIGEQDETELSLIDKRIAAICKKYGVLVEKSSKSKTLKSVTNTRKLMRTDGENCLCWIFEVIERSHWDKYNNAYSHLNIEGLRKVYKANIDSLEVAMQKMVNSMLYTNPQEIWVTSGTKFKNLSRNQGYIEAIASLAV